MIAGVILENFQGKFAKVVRVQEEGGLYTLTAWVPSKEAAEVETVGVITLNKFGLSQVLKDTSILEEEAEGAEKPLAKMTVAELQAKAAELGLSTEGTKKELIAVIEAKQAEGAE